MTDKERFNSLRKRVFKLIAYELDQDPHCKSYEGTIELVTSYPDYFEDSTAEKGIDYCKITLHCYVLGSGRHHDFIGKNFKEALDEFERQIKRWERMAEVEE